METPQGNVARNQLTIKADEGTYFQSYGVIVAFRPTSGPIQLDEYYWNYSQTVGRYRNRFLHEGIAATRAKIKSGEYILTHLNQRGM